MTTFTPTSHRAAALSVWTALKSVQTGLPASTLAPLQRAQKSAADLFLIYSTTRVTAALQIHWSSPAEVTIISFNVATILRNVFRRRSTTTALLTYWVTDSLRCRPLSSSVRCAFVRPTRTQSDRRAFSVCARPDDSNSPPPTTEMYIRGDLVILKRNLKLFQILADGRTTKTDEAQ